MESKTIDLILRILWKADDDLVRIVGRDSPSRNELRDAWNDFLKEAYKDAPKQEPEIPLKEEPRP